MRLLIVTLALAVSTGGFAQDDDAERRIINYIKENAKPDERLVLSVLYNEVFTTLAERAALDKLTGAFFRIPLFVIEFEDRQGRLPTLEDIFRPIRFLRSRGGRCRVERDGIRPSRPEIHRAGSEDRRDHPDRHWTR